MFALHVARRYLLSNPSQTLLLIAGVALGVTVFVFITALIAGLAVRLTEQVTGNGAHISLDPPTRVARVLAGPDLPVESVALVSTFQRQQIRNWPMIVELLRTNPGISAISPQISGSAVLIKSEAVTSVSVIGVEPQGIDAISEITPKIIDGDGDLGADGLLIGVRMAEDLGLSAGQSVLLRTERGVERQLTVKGVFSTGLQSLDERIAFLSLQTARPLFVLPEGVTNIEIKLKDPEDARATARFLAGATGLRATPWQEKNLNLEDALVAQGRTGTMIQVFSLISIIIGVASALVLSAYRRHHAGLRRPGRLYPLGLPAAGAADRFDRGPDRLRHGLWPVHLAGRDNRRRRRAGPADRPGTGRLCRRPGPDHARGGDRLDPAGARGLEG